MNDATARSEKRGKAGWIIATVTIGFLLILGYGLRPQFASPLGAPAPDFTLSLFDGGELSLADLRGSVVVVNFWASWCSPCRDEAPVLERVWREYKDKDVVFVGVDFKDVTTKAMAFIEEFDITYPNGPDPYNRISGAYHITGVPETFLIAQDGRLIEWYIGPITETSLRAALEELLQ
ncbi:MAG: TlpA family protein disulfide reductase [Anaerolineales bacterium]|nr:TlpA family protein disulfide reductase [Anaerolineales bacterium]